MQKSSQNWPRGNPFAPGVLSTWRGSRRSEALGSRLSPCPQASRPAAGHPAPHQNRQGQGPHQGHHHQAGVPHLRHLLLGADREGREGGRQGERHEAPALRRLRGNVGPGETVPSPALLPPRTPPSPIWGSHITSLLGSSGRRSVEWFGLEGSLLAGSSSGCPKPRPTQFRTLPTLGHPQLLQAKAVPVPHHPDGEGFLPEIQRGAIPEALP